MNNRQTNLSLSEILDLLNGGGNSHPKCLLLNELGIICKNGEDENEAGEKYLLTTLEQTDVNDKCIAFCCLSLIPGAKEKYAAEMNSFRANPENKEFLPFIDTHLAKYQ